MSEPTRLGAELGDPQQLVDRLRRAAERAPRRPEPPPVDVTPSTLGAPPRVPPRYHARLDDLEQTDAVKTARVWLDQVRTRPDHDVGLLMLGLPGRGKSLIAGALAVAMGAPQFAQFWPTPDLIRAMQADIGQRDRIPVGERILRRRLLVLDDVGAEQATDWRVGELNGLIEAVYSRRMLLVATSNLTLEQLGEHLGERVVSRLHEMTDLVVVDGPDRRKG